MACSLVCPPPDRRRLRLPPRFAASPLLMTALLQSLCVHDRSAFSWTPVAGASACITPVAIDRPQAAARNLFVRHLEVVCCCRRPPPQAACSAVDGGEAAQALGSWSNRRSSAVPGIRKCWSARCTPPAAVAV